MAAELKTRPADLTLLAKKYGSPLPKQKLLEFVDGRSMPRAHGSAEMPVWGENLLGRVPPGPATEAHKRASLLVILDWIESLQAK
jgi:hypothetical protein